MRHILIISVTLAVILGFVFISTFTVSESEYVVVTQFGKPSRTIRMSGLYFKRPSFLETVNRIDRRTHVFTTQPIQLLLGDKTPVVLTFYLSWRVRDPLLFFQSLINSEIAAQKLGDMVSSQAGTVLGDYKIDNIINTNPAEIKISTIEDRILNNTNARTKGKYGIEAAQVGIRNIAYPTVVANAVHNRMRSERKKVAMKYRAEGKEYASRIGATADRKASEILAEAYKKAAILRGEGDQQALKIYSEAYGKDSEFFEFMRSMEAYKVILSQKSTLVLSTDSELFKYFNNPQGGKQK